MRRGTWTDFRWLNTHRDIERAAGELRADGQAVTASALAVKAGCNRKTVERHFPRPLETLAVEDDLWAFTVTC